MSGGVAFWVYTRTTVDTYVVARVFLFCPSSQYRPVVISYPPERRSISGECYRPPEKSVEEASGFEDLNGKRREEPAFATIPTVSA